MLSVTARIAPIVALGLAACATYSPGSFAARGESFTGELTTVGCLDLAVAGTRDAVAPGPIVDFQFGNRCDHAVHVDLAAVRATGRTTSGEEVALVCVEVGAITEGGTAAQLCVAPETRVAEVTP